MNVLHSYIQFTHPANGQAFSSAFQFLHILSFLFPFCPYRGTAVLGGLRVFPGGVAVGRALGRGFGVSTSYIPWNGCTGRKTLNRRMTTVRVFDKKNTYPLWQRGPARRHHCHRALLLRYPCARHHADPPERRDCPDEKVRDIWGYSFRSAAEHHIVKAVNK